MTYNVVFWMIISLVKIKLVVNDENWVCNGNCKRKRVGDLLMNYNILARPRMMMMMMMLSQLRFLMLEVDINIIPLISFLSLTALNFWGLDGPDRKSVV